MPEGEYAFYIWDRINGNWIGFSSIHDFAADQKRMIYVMTKKIFGLNIQIFRVSGTKTYIAKEQHKHLFSF